MLLLVSGASGVGKSTSRAIAAPLLGDAVEAVELVDLGPIPPVPTIAWRQQQVETAVRRAIELEADGRHLLLAGDPVAFGEVVAAPSADRIDVAGCLIDLDAETQTARLRERGDPEEYLVHHLAYAAWLRRHAEDPSHLAEVLTTNCWPEMRWERWIGRTPGPPWAMHVIDADDLDRATVGAAIARWSQEAIAGRADVLPAGWAAASRD